MATKLVARQTCCECSKLLNCCVTFQQNVDGTLVGVCYHRSGLEAKSCWHKFGYDMHFSDRFKDRLVEELVR